jgi:hypothetical protein
MRLSSSFRFEKLYADLVTPEGAVCIAYIAHLDAWGLASAHAGLEIYWPDGRREVVHGRPFTDPKCLDYARAIELRFDVPGGPFVLRYRVIHGAWAPPGEPTADGLRWSVKVARAEAEGRWMNDPARPVLRGTGYADWVEIDRPLRAIGLRRVRWGRVHFPDSTLVFDAVDLRGGRTWQRAARWSSDTAVDVPCPPPLDFHPVRALHVGDAIDAARFPRTLDRAVSIAMTGAAVEERRLDRARDHDSTGGGEAWALHEEVRFGRAATTDRASIVSPSRPSPP